MKTFRSQLRSLVLGAAMTAATIAFAQADTPRLVELPSLSIEGSTITSTVTFDSTRKVYRYTYRIDVPATVQAPVQGFALDLRGREARPQTDPDLQSNFVPLYPGRQLQPNTMIPVGVQVPSPSTTRVSLNAEGWLAVRFKGWSVPAGGSATGFVVESKLPPGPRQAILRPDDSAWDALQLQYRGSDEVIVFSPSSANQYFVKTETTGPFDYDTSTLYLGGGQNGAEVNPFLRFAWPTDSRTRLTAATATKRVVVFFGPSTDPATFTADLNGVDVRSRFSVIPGGASAVEFTFGPGTSKLKLSIQGKTSSGHTARDTDTLTFLVE
ncbi:MAG: hypothetical protein ACJ74H_01105 [Thermoanaerobaculia bacterium]